MKLLLKERKSCLSVTSVTEIPWMDECSKQKLLLLLGDWYEPESFDSIFSSIASDDVHFSS